MLQQNKRWNPRSFGTANSVFQRLTPLHKSSTMRQYFIAGLVRKQGGGGVLRRCEITETRDWQLQRNTDCRGQKVEPGSTSGTRGVSGESGWRMRRRQLDHRCLHWKWMGTAAFSLQRWIWCECSRGWHAPKGPGCDEGCSGWGRSLNTSATHSIPAEHSQPSDRTHF